MKKFEISYPTEAKDLKEKTLDDILRLAPVLRRTGAEALLWDDRLKFKVRESTEEYIGSRRVYTLLHVRVYLHQYELCVFAVELAELRKLVARGGKKTKGKRRTARRT